MRRLVLSALPPALALAALLGAPGPGTAAQPTPAPVPAAIVSMADGPVRLIRGAAVYRLAAGGAVRQDDILETAAAGAQVEAGPAIVALGPDTRLLLARLPGKGGIEVALLSGWVKVAAPGGARVVAPTLLVALPAGVTIVRHHGDAAAVFAEEGAQQAMRPGGRGKQAVTARLVSEQYATFAADKPVVGRPAADFLAALPPAFRDTLVPAGAVPNAGKVAPVKEREASFADVADWLRAPAPLRKGFVARFRPRLADPAFRRELEAAFGASAEWRPILAPASPPMPQPGSHPNSHPDSRPGARRPPAELF